MLYFIRNFKDDGVFTNDGITMEFYSDGWLKRWNGTDLSNIMAYSANTWYRMSIEFDVNDDWHLWVDGQSKDGGAGWTLTGIHTYLDRFYLMPTGVSEVQLDAVGYYSWDPNYEIEDNNMLNNMGDYPDHIYAPDSTGAMWTMDPLYMQSNFPDKAINEDFSGWTTSYDSIYTDTEFPYSNGNFDSAVKKREVQSVTHGGSYTSLGTMDSLKYDDGDYYEIKRGELSFDSSHVTDSGNEVTSIAPLFNIIYEDFDFDDPWSLEYDEYRRYYDISSSWGLYGMALEIIDEYTMDSNIQLSEGILTDINFSIYEKSWMIEGEDPTMYHEIFNDDAPSWQAWEILGSRTLSTSDNMKLYNYNSTHLNPSYDITSYIDENGKFRVRNRIECYYKSYGMEMRARAASDCNMYTVETKYIPNNVEPVFNFESGLFNEEDYRLFIKARHLDDIEAHATLDATGGYEYEYYIYNSWTVYSFEIFYELGIEDVIKLIFGTDQVIQTVQIEYLYLYSEDTGTIHEAELNKTIDDPFLNQYDSFENYQKKYNVTVSFKYKFNKAVSDLPYSSAEVVINGNTYGLSATSSWTSIQYNFEFDSASASGFDIVFRTKNGYLDLQSMSYYAKFKCLDTSGHIKLFQSITADYPYHNSLTQFEKDNGQFYLNFTYDFVTFDDGIIYYNAYDRTDKLEVIATIKADGAWQTAIPLNQTSTSTSGAYRFDVRGYMNSQGWSSFEDIKLEFMVSGEPSSLTVTNVSLFDYRAWYPAELEFTIDANMPNLAPEDTLERVELFYRYDTDPIIDTFGLYIYNYNTLGWDLVNATQPTSGFLEGSYVLSSDHYDANHNMQFKTNGTYGVQYNYGYQFDFLLDKFYVEYDWTRTSGEINADLIKTIDDPLLNRYDSFDDYKKLYAISIDFDYQFITQDTNYGDFAEFYVETTEGSFVVIPLTKDGQINNLQYSFEFDSASRADFDIKFRISNGDLDLSSFLIDITFKCLKDDVSGDRLLQQWFEVDYPEEDSLSQNQKENANFYCDIYYDFATVDDGLSYVNSYGRNFNFFPRNIS